MGRSVNYLNNAIKVLYFNVAPETNKNGKITDHDEEGNEFERELEEFDYECTWDDFFGNVLSTLKANGYYKVEKRWEGNEVRIIAENRFAEIGLSDYCGVASLSIRVKEWDGIGEHQVRVRTAIIESGLEELFKALIDNTYHQAYNRIGGFSNGESVYSKVA